MTKVKICGITRLQDARDAIEAGADMLGLNFYEVSPRYIAPEQAAELCVALRSEYGADCPLLVGVFVNADADFIESVRQRVGLDYAQLSGDELPETLAQIAGCAFKAVRPPDLASASDAIERFMVALSDERAPMLLLDAYHPALYGGTGEQARADLVMYVRERVPRLMLAGGLNPENVAERVHLLRPWGVDVASGVENGQPGIKSAELIRAFITAARSV